MRTTTRLITGLVLGLVLVLCACTPRQVAARAASTSCAYVDAQTLVNLRTSGHATTYAAHVWRIDGLVVARAAAEDESFSACSSSRSLVEAVEAAQP